ncbi:MAG: anti-sigma factor antagonist [Planctomycetia bacterium]
MDVTIERRDRGDAVDLVVAGRLDAETAGELARVVAEELRRGRHEIGLDLDAVGFLSSAGIRVLFETHRSAKAAGGSCLIRTASAAIRRVLDLTRLTPILMAGEAATSAAAAAAEPTAATLHADGVTLVGLERPAGGPLLGRLVGTDGSPADGGAKHAFPRHAFGLGLGTLADDAAVPERAGELLAACGAVFQRPPRPFAVVDYLVAAGDLVPAARFATGLVWHGLPAGRAGFEPADGEPAVSLDTLAAAALDQAAAETVAVVAVGEVHGLVGAELIRPLAEATAGDRPGTADRETARRWLSFSREPVHARRTALVVGVATRTAPGGPLAAFLRPLGRPDLLGHFHAAVFPLRPLRRSAVDLAATVADLAGSEPLAVMHLLADPDPVLGSGRPEFVRGGLWFAPLAVPGEPAA